MTTNDEIPRDLVHVNGKTPLQHWQEFKSGFYAEDPPTPGECYRAGFKAAYDAALPLAKLGDELVQAFLLERRRGESFTTIDLEQWATEHGLIEPITVNERCGERCVCADYGEFPQQCYRVTPAARALDNPQEKVDDHT